MPDDTKHTHPTYGMIGASRVTSGPKGLHLFGSRIRHSAMVDITIRRASIERSLNRDWFHGEADGLITVRLTEAQWATFVSSMNIGYGTPCSLTRVGTQDCGPVPPPDNSIAQAKHEAKKQAARAVSDLMHICERMENAAQNPKKREFAELIHQLRVAVGSFSGNHQFLYDSFEEHVENLVTDAKASIEAHFASIAMRSAGLTLTESAGSAPQIEQAKQEEQA